MAWYIYQLLLQYIQFLYDYIGGYKFKEPFSRKLLNKNLPYLLSLLLPTFQMDIKQYLQGYNSFFVFLFIIFPRVFKLKKLTSNKKIFFSYIKECLPCRRVSALIGRGTDTATVRPQLDREMDRLRVVFHKKTKIDR